MPVEKWIKDYKSAAPDIMGRARLAVDEIAKSVVPINMGISLLAIACNEVAAILVVPRKGLLVKSPIFCWEQRVIIGVERLYLREATGDYKNQKDKQFWRQNLNYDKEAVSALQSKGWAGKITKAGKYDVKTGELMEVGDYYPIWGMMQGVDQGEEGSPAARFFEWIFLREKWPMLSLLSIGPTQYFMYQAPIVPGGTNAKYPKDREELWRLYASDNGPDALKHFSKGCDPKGLGKEKWPSEVPGDSAYIIDWLWKCETGVSKDVATGYYNGGLWYNKVGYKNWLSQIMDYAKSKKYI